MQVSMAQEMKMIEVPFSSVIPAKAGIQTADAVGAGSAGVSPAERLSRQNQDLRDYRIFRILPARFRAASERSSVFVLAGFSDYGEKRVLDEEKS